MLEDCKLGNNNSLKIKKAYNGPPISNTLLVGQVGEGRER